MKEKYKDTDLREALRRKYADTPKLPDDFMAKMGERLQPKPVAKTRTLWRWMAAAACLLLVAGVGLTMLNNRKQTETAPLTAKTTAQSLPAKTTAQPLPSLVGEGPGVGSVTKTTETKNKQKIQKIQTPPRPTATPPLEGRGAAAPLSSRGGTAPLSSRRGAAPVESTPKVQAQPNTAPPVTANPNLHYAAHVQTEDTIAYQAPSRLDEFIAKLAEYNKVKAVPLNCTSDIGPDTTIVSTAYLFEEKPALGSATSPTEELDLFAKLLQVACWYDTKTPGYLLNFSRQQFIFCLKDLRKGLKYLWVAERIGNRYILLYSTHSPIETEVSSACFQEYREQLTHKGINILNF